MRTVCTVIENTTKQANREVAQTTREVASNVQRVAVYSTMFYCKYVTNAAFMCCSDAPVWVSWEVFLWTFKWECGNKMETTKKLCCTLLLRAMR